LKPILIMTLVSAFAVLTVINMNLAKPKAVSENTLDMLEIMTRAFDESEGGEGTGPAIYEKPSRYDCGLEGTVNAEGEVFGFGKWIKVHAEAGSHFEINLKNTGTDCQQGNTWQCVYRDCISILEAYFASPN